MTIWTDQDLLRLDIEFAQVGIPRHARPMRAAMSILGGSFVIGVYNNPDVARIIADYRKLFPESDESWPGKGVGMAASVDSVRKVTVAVIFGTCSVSVHRGLGFETHEAWVRWCRGDPMIAACSAFAFADLHDLTYGIESGNVKPPNELWRMALSNLEDTSNILANGFSVDSVLQPICLTAELSMKAALTDLGVDRKDLARREVGHSHVALARKLTALRPHRDDLILHSVVAALPDYVQTRYTAAGLTRLAVVKLALGAQFIAASACRRISTRDFAAELERDRWPGPRSADFYI